MGKYVFLSPHFDDAAYSCGGTIVQLVQQGEDVTVVTVMGGSLPDPVPQSPLIAMLHARWAVGSDPIAIRQQEDHVAIAALGATLIQLPVPDCIYRTVNGVILYPDEVSLWGAIHLQDNINHWLSDTTIVTEFMQNADVLYAPLGVGQHVDHRLTRLWALELAKQFSSVSLQFYTDYPYMKDTKQISIALTQLSVAVQPRWVHLSHDELDAKIAAMGKYTSQISSFWQDTDALRHDVETTFRVKNNLWGERYWIRA